MVGNRVFPIELTELEVAFLNHALVSLRGQWFTQVCQAGMKKDDKEVKRIDANLDNLDMMIERMPKLDTFRNVELTFDSRRYRIK